MPAPTTSNQPDSSASKDPAQRAAAGRILPQHGDPRFQQQDQASPLMEARPDWSSSETPSPQVEAEQTDVVTSSPPVTPIYLRSVGKKGPDAPQHAAAPATVQAKAGASGSESLIDAITIGIAELIASSLHATVAEAVRSLAPQMAISFGADEPDEEGARPAAGTTAAAATKTKLDTTPARS